MKLKSQQVKRAIPKLKSNKDAQRLTKIKQLRKRRPNNFPTKQPRSSPQKKQLLQKLKHKWLKRKRKPPKRTKKRRNLSNQKIK
jgi:hypothetical protein